MQPGLRGSAGTGVMPMQGGSSGFKSTRRAPKGSYVPSGYRAGRLDQYTPQQHQLFQQSANMLGPDSYLARLAGGDQSLFEEMERPAWDLFGQAQSQIGNRYSQLAPGAMSAQGSSGFQSEMGQLGSDFASNLAANRQALRRQAINDLMGMSNTLLNQRPYENFMFAKSQDPNKGKPLGGWGGLAGAGLGGAVGFFSGGGPAGALEGAQIGYGFGQGL